MIRASAVAVAALAMGLASTANAASITWQWVSVNNVAVAPTATVALSASDTAVLELLVTPDSSGNTLTSISVSFDPSQLQVLNTQVCPPGTGNPGGAFGFCGDPFGAFPTLTQIGTETVDNVNGEVLTLAASTLNSPGQSAPAVYTLAAITFHATGAGNPGGITPVDPLFITGIDDFVDGTFTSIPFNTFGGNVIVPVVPEPGTLALVGLGLGALAFAGRRRR